MKTQRFSVFVSALAIILFSGCASDYLRNDTYRANEKGFQVDDDSKIPDTAENREILDVVARYRSALVRKDIGTIKTLVSPDYYENSGTTNTTEDDYGAPDLPKIYELLAKHTSDLRYDITVKELHVDGDNSDIDYEYQYAYHFFVDGKPSWDAGVDINRLKLSKKDGVWKIVSGL